MKYTSTHRLFNTILFGVLTAGFAVLVLFFTFLWEPTTLIRVNAIDGFDATKSYAFYANLGSLFTALLIVSGAGLFYSVKSLMNTKDDKLVVRSYCCYAAYGYVVTVFCLLNALWLNSLIGGAEPTFWIILCIVMAIVSMIAANVPMMKLLEDDKENLLSLLVSGALLAVSCGAFLNFIVPLFFTFGSKLSLKFAQDYLVWFTVLSAVSAALNVLGMVAVKKGGKYGEYANLFSVGSILPFAGIPTVCAVTELVKHSKNITEKVTLLNVYSKQYSWMGDKFAILSIVTASLMVVIVIGFTAYTLVDLTKKTAK